MINTINEAINRKLNSISFTTIIKGTVESLEPLKVRISNKIVIGLSFIEPRSLGIDDSSPSPALPLVVGEEIEMVRYNNGQRFYVLGKAASGGTVNYNDLQNKPILNTNNTASQSVKIDEVMGGTIKLHKISKTGSYNDLRDKPTKVSEFTNDAGYLTEHQDISNLATKDELHFHNNKSVLDSITQENIDNWNNSIGEVLPIGTMLPYTSKVIPNGFLPCDGSEVSRTEYKDLFAIIGTSYGAGDGSTTFNLPNKKGRVSVGLDFNQTEFNTIGKKGGEKTHTLTLSEIIQHDLWTCNGDYNPNIRTAFNGGSSYGINTHNKTNTQPHNNLQPYEVDQWIIKAFNGAYSQPVSGDVNDTLPVGSIIKFDGDYIPEGYEEVENPGIEFYTSGTSFTAKYDCYAEVFVTAYGWGYGGAESYLNISKSGDPEVILEQFGKTRGHDTVPDCVTSFGVYKLKKGNTYQFTSGPFVPNGGTNATAGYVKLTPIN